MDDLAFDLQGEPPSQIQINAYAQTGIRWEVWSIFVAILAASTAVAPLQSDTLRQNLTITVLDGVEIAHYHFAALLFLAMSVLCALAYKRYKVLCMLLPASAEDHAQALVCAAQYKDVLAAYSVKVIRQGRRLTQVEVALIRHIAHGEALVNVENA
jgi:hypothetical protein